MESGIETGEDHMIVENELTEMVHRHWSMQTILIICNISSQMKVSSINWTDAKANQTHKSQIMFILLKFNSGIA